MLIMIKLRPTLSTLSVLEIDGSMTLKLINSGAVDIIRTVYYIHRPELMKLIFAVLYVS